MKKVIIIFLIVGVIGGAVAYYMYNKPKTDYSDAKVDTRLKADELFEAFTLNEQEAGAKYLNKVLAVDGIITLIEKNQKGETVIYLGSNDPMFGIQVTMLPSDSTNFNNLKAEKQVILKGLCTGFANDVVLTNGSIEKE